jgi:hypothetical protein
VADRQHVVHFDGFAWISAPSRANGYVVEGQQVLGARQPAIPDPAGGPAVDTQARDAIATILTVMRTHGLIAS